MHQCALRLGARTDARRGASRRETQVQHPPYLSSHRTVLLCAPEHLSWGRKKRQTTKISLRVETLTSVVMEFPTVPSEDFREVYSVSVIPYLNATFLEDLLTESSKSNQTSGVQARNTTGLIIAVCITALYSLICVLGLLGNVLVMYGVIR